MRSYVLRLGKGSSQVRTTFTPFIFSRATSLRILRRYSAGHFARGMIGKSGQHRDFVPLLRPVARQFSHAGGRRSHLRRKIL